jgi:CubicO group peptidase (beta-lactamase class C family)
MISNSVPNPDLTVGRDNKQGWNQPEQRRHGFHNAHRLWRRMLMVRSRRILNLQKRRDRTITEAVKASGLTGLPTFSALVIAEGDHILYSAHARDFGPDRPHSIQSITKMHAHLIFGELIAESLVSLDRKVRDYLPWIGSGYADARLQDVLDMNVANDFTEDYADPFSGCYAEEEALGWRLPNGNRPEISLTEFVAAIGSKNLKNETGSASYKSANTDVLTLVAAAVSPVYLAARIEAIADAAGYEGSFHINLSRDLMPAFSGGGCLSARDLARFGLLIARGGEGVSGGHVGDAAFTRSTLTRPAPALGPGRRWIRYSNQTMTNGRWIGHGGYGGQFLMVDMETGRVAAFLSVLENASGYDEDYMREVILSLERILGAAA